MIVDTIHPSRELQLCLYIHIHIAYNDLGESKKRLLLGDFSYRFSYLSLFSSRNLSNRPHKVEHISMHLYECKLFPFLVIPK